jgi:hypothetical protein
VGGEAIGTTGDRGGRLLTVEPRERPFYPLPIPFPLLIGRCLRLGEPVLRTLSVTLGILDCSSSGNPLGAALPTGGWSGARDMLSGCWASSRPGRMPQNAHLLPGWPVRAGGSLGFGACPGDGPQAGGETERASADKGKGPPAS